MSVSLVQVPEGVAGVWDPLRGYMFTAKGRIIDLSGSLVRDIFSEKGITITVNVYITSRWHKLIGIGYLYVVDTDTFIRWSIDLHNEYGPMISDRYYRYEMSVLPFAGFQNGLRTAYYFKRGYHMSDWYRYLDDQYYTDYYLSLIHI